MESFMRSGVHADGPFRAQGRGGRDRSSVEAGNCPDACRLLQGLVACEPELRSCGQPQDPL
jgi:hypothetical protein